jgi:hypothetical protein
MALKEYLDAPSHSEKYKKSLPGGEMHDAIVSLQGTEYHGEDEWNLPIKMPVLDQRHIYIHICVTYTPYQVGNLRG